MAIKAVLMESFGIGVGIVAAKGYDASWDQAATFITVNEVVLVILQCLVCSYIQNSRQLALADIVIVTTAGFAGVLATRLFCEKEIHWKAAVVSSVFSGNAAGYVSAIFLKPIDIEKLKMEL